MPPGRQLGGEEGPTQTRDVKSDGLRNVEVLDEEEGGWAGHHEEVDYSKVRGASCGVMWDRRLCLY